MMIATKLLKHRPPTVTSIVGRICSKLPSLLTQQPAPAGKPVFDNDRQLWVFPDGSTRPLGFMSSGASATNSWTKHSYALWIEQVKEKFKIGQYVTHRKNAISPGWCPLPYKVVGIEEMHRFVTMDIERNLPKALMVCLVGTTTPAYWVPDDARHLTEDEKAKEPTIQRELQNDRSKDTESEFPTREDAIGNPNQP